MPTNGDDDILLVDTSVAVALVIADHPHHNAVFQTTAEKRLGLAGHAAFETFSVLTRLPPPARSTPRRAARLIVSNFPWTRHLSATRAAELLTELADRGIAGGAVYDALVAAAAGEHGLPLLTRDRRALDTYRELKVDARLVE